MTKRTDETADTCSLCGGKLPNDKQVVVDLASNVLRVGNKKIVLTARQAELMYLLNAEYPQPVSMDRIILKIYGINEPNWSATSIYIYIYQLRNCIKDMGIIIVTMFKREGYRLAYQ